MIEYINAKKINFKKNPPEILKSESTILNKETKEYIDALINLEISVLDKNSISESTLKQLIELKFFENLIIYNLYNRTKRLTKGNNQRNLINLMNGFSVEYKDPATPTDEEHLELLKFVYDEMILNLYQGNIESLQEIIERRDKEIIRLEKRIKQIKESRILDLDKIEEIEIVIKKLQALRKLTPQMMQQQHEINKRESEQQQIILEQILTENNLSLSDFEELNIKGGKKFLVKKYPHASIYIHR